MNKFNFLNSLVLFFILNIINIRSDFFNDDNKTFNQMFEDMHKEMVAMHNQMNADIARAQSINYSISKNNLNNINYSYEKNDNGYLISLKLPDYIEKENIKAKNDKKNKKVTVYIKSDDLNGQIDINENYCVFKINMNSVKEKNNEDKNNKKNKSYYKSVSSSSQSQTFAFDLKINLNEVKPVFNKEKKELTIQLNTLEKVNDIIDLEIADL